MDNCGIPLICWCMNWIKREDRENKIEFILFIQQYLNYKDSMGFCSQLLVHF